MSNYKFKNKQFKNVKDKLEYIQKHCKETELYDDLVYLLKCKGFENVRINHGNKEYGKDIIFSKYNKEFDENKWYAAIVKNKKASQNDFMQGNEIGNQINLAFNSKYINEKSEEIQISNVFIIINGSISGNAKAIIADFIDKPILEHIKIYDYQKLKEEIEKFSEESFLDNFEPSLNMYLKNQKNKLSDVTLSNNLFDLDINDINDIFVNVQTSYSNELKKMNKYVSYKNSKERYKEGDIEGSDEIVKSKKNFIIHGIATSGKTLFLKRIGIRALDEKEAKSNAVFYFDFNNSYMNKNNFNVQALIESQYSDLTQKDEFNSDDHDKIILLFDSIDFINHDNKNEILKKIESFSENDKSNKYQIVIATRDLSYIKDRSLFEKFEETELLPFNFGQALKLVKKIIPDNNSKANNFITALKNSMLNSSLQKTPLALTLLAILYRDDKVDLNELPANIFSLYDRFTDVYLDEWDSSRGVTQLYKYEQTKNILGFIAFHMHSNILNVINENDLRLFLIDLRKSYNYDELNNIDKFISHLKNQNEIFIYDKSSQLFYFFNHYFQEYFSSIKVEHEESEIFIDKFFDEWWSNSLVFYCGKNPKSSKLHKKILNDIVPVDLRQKFYYLNQHSKCLQGSHAISIKDRTKIIERLLFEFDSFFEKLYSDAQTDSDALFNNVPFVNLINQSRNLFETVFSSKHISTVETIEYFENCLVDNNEFTAITNYNIAFFLAFTQNISSPIEIFEGKHLNDVIWNRILYVDIEFLKLKKRISQEKYNRIRRKMNKHQYLIQYNLQSSIYDQKKKIAEKKRN